LHETLSDTYSWVKWPIWFT